MTRLHSPNIADELLKKKTKLSIKVISVYDPLSLHCSEQCRSTASIGEGNGKMCLDRKKNLNGELPIGVNVHQVL